jgi:hypothetical protein
VLPTGKNKSGSSSRHRPRERQSWVEVCARIGLHVPALAGGKPSTSVAT